MFLYLRNNFAHTEVKSEAHNTLKLGWADMAGCAEDLATLRTSEDDCQKQTRSLELP